MLANSWESIMTVRVQILEGKLHILIFVTLNVRFVVGLPWCVLPEIFAVLTHGCVLIRRG